MIYTYDFGDDWFHEVILEKVIDSNRPGCVVCAAKGKSPPDDCGGPFGYELLKKSLREPKSQDYAETLDWLDIESGDEWNIAEPDVKPGDIVETVDFDEFKI